MQKDARLEARVTPEVHALLKRAAEIEGRSMTDFIVAAASAAARQTIEQVEVIRLSRQGQEAFAAALLDPPEITPTMQRAIASHRRLIAPE
ncbi:MAG: DUF1778 domain-containing protein [Geminicoccaceae bacterium]